MSSDPITSIVPPSSGLTNTDMWTISAVTNSIAQVGVHVVTVTATFTNYPSVPAKTVTFNLTVIDNCATALLNNKSQVLNAMVYVPLTATVPSL